MAHPEHHVLYSARIWRSQKPTKELRANKWLQVPLEQEAHDEIHRKIASMPLPDHFSAERIKREFEPIPGDYLGTLGKLIVATEQAANHPKAREIERHMGHLLIDALYIQWGIIEQGLIT